MLENLLKNTIVKTSALAILGYAALTGVDATYNTNIVTKPAYAQEQKKVEEITEKEIKKYMAMKTCEDILAGTDVKYATYQGRGRTDLHKLLETDKPAMVLFYGNYDDSKGGYSKRDTIIFKKLIEKYGDKINFIVYNTDKNSGAERTRYDGVATRNNLFGVNTFRIPSIVMFSYFDLLKGETPEKNDGKLKQIDILRGGPDADWRIQKEWLPFLKDNWVKENIINPNGKSVYRFNNSCNEQKKNY